MDSHDPTNADDSPDYGSIVTSGWSCDDWRTWYFAVKAKYGVHAKTVWQKAWDDVPFYAYERYVCSLEPSFNHFLKDEGIDTNIVSDTVVFAQDTVSSAENLVTNTLKAGESLTSSLKWILPVAAGIILLIVFSNVKNATA